VETRAWHAETTAIEIGESFDNCLIELFFTP
jgi:hypothetical protein